MPSGQDVGRDLVSVRSKFLFQLEISDSLRTSWLKKSYKLMKILERSFGFEKLMRQRSPEQPEAFRKQMSSSTLNTTK